MPGTVALSDLGEANQNRSPAKPSGAARAATLTRQGLLAAGTQGGLAPGDGAQIMALVETYRRALEASDMEAIEVALAGRAT